MNTIRTMSMLAALSGFLSAACSSEEFTPFSVVELSVLGAGTGQGTVVAGDEGVLDLSCSFPSEGQCGDDFEDAGGGGVFTLVAIPLEGSVFAGWTGCTSVSGNICTLRFADGEEPDFQVTARFEAAEGRDSGTGIPGEQGGIDHSRDEP